MLLCAEQMQQAELEVARQRDANLTALAAIGPRKRKQLDISGATSSQVGAGSDLAAPISSQDTSSPQVCKAMTCTHNVMSLAVLIGCSYWKLIDIG